MVMVSHRLFYFFLYLCLSLILSHIFVKAIWTSLISIINKLNERTLILPNFSIAH